MQYLSAAWLTRSRLCRFWSWPLSPPLDDADEDEEDEEEEELPLALLPRLASLSLPLLCVYVRVL